MGGAWPTTPSPFTDVSTGSGDSSLKHVCRLDTLQTTNVRFELIMPAYPLRADVVARPSERLQLARSGSSSVAKFCQLKGRNRPEAVIQVSCRERPLLYRGLGQGPF